MAVRTGDTFQIPITLKDEMSKSVEILVKGAKRLKASFDKASLSIIAVNQAFEIAGKVARTTAAIVRSTLYLLPK